MTTNDIERLDPALIRPGRCDLQVKFDAASKLQIKNMFTRFFPEVGVQKHRSINTHPVAIEQSPQLADDFVAACPDKQLSMASLQGHMMKWQHDAHAAVEHVEDLVKSRGQVRESCLCSTRAETMRALGEQVD